MTGRPVAVRVVGLADALVAVPEVLGGRRPVTGRLGAIGLGGRVALPLAIVFLGWLSGLRGGTRGWG